VTRWPPALAAPAEPVLLLVDGFGDGGLARAMGSSLGRGSPRAVVRGADGPRSHRGGGAERVGGLLERLEPSDLRREFHLRPTGARDEAAISGARAR
jgi:hypothetical protein